MKADTATGSGEIRCLSAALGNAQMMLPGTLVAEVVSYQEPEPYPGVSPVVDDWLLGRRLWRGEWLPLVSLEGLSGAEIPAAGSRARVIVVKSVREGGSTGFWGLVTQEIPRLVPVAGGALSPGDATAPGTALIAATLDGQPVVIPDVPMIEDYLAERVVG